MFIVTTVVALVLALMFNALKPIHDRNEAIFNKRAILMALGDELGSDLKKTSDTEVLELFDSKIEQVTLDMEGQKVPDTKAEEVSMAQEMKKAEDDRNLPLYIFTNEAGKKFYILSLRGKGLWDAIWGSIALEDDLNTIAGVSFDHQAETPGLGAEIKDNPDWFGQYTGKKLYNEAGEYKSVITKKGGAKDPNHEIDAISGATITADGVSEMMYRGLQYYEPYLRKNK